MPIEAPLTPEKPKEIERKFLVKDIPEDIDNFPHTDIKQGYISIEDDGTEIRVRQKANTFFKTIKSGSGAVRTEAENPITEEEFNTAWTKTEGRRIEKRRYEIKLDEEHLAELDMYQSDLQGLFVVEVEFASKDDMDNFIPPSWFGADVTENNAFKNANLALQGKPEDISNKKEYALEEGVKVLVREIEQKSEGKDKPTIVLIAGGSASGKTSAVASKVKENFGDNAIILSLDDYYRGKKFMDEMSVQGKNYNWDQPEVLNLDLFSQQLDTLKSGQPIEKPVYNFSIGESDKTEKIDPKKIIIVEGLFALNEKLKDLGDVKAFVEVGTHGRLIRRILRDIESRGQNPDDILDYFAKVVQPMHDEYVESTKKEADIVISNEYDPAIEARGMKEMQLKFQGKIDQNTLRKVGAERINSSEQLDTYYNPVDKDLSKTGELLRVREESGHVVVSYKGPREESEFRVRPKIDFEINSKTRDSFIDMYKGAVKVIKKERTLYHLKRVIFSLDTVSKIEDGQEVSLGDFIEIRDIDSSNDEDPLNAVLKLLDLDIAKGDKRSYAEM